jgi:hypothetical protein
MGEPIIRPTLPEDGGGKAPADKQPGDNGQHNDVRTPNGNKGGNTKSIIISVIVFAAFEALGVYFWQIADALAGNLRIFVHWISLCFLVAGPFSAWHEMVNGSKRWVWSSYGFACILNGLVALLVWHPTRQPPQPHFTLSLQAGDDPDSIVDLTNDFLFVSEYSLSRTNSDGRLWFNGTTRACILVPLSPYESNKVFTVTAENDSSIKVSDLEVAVGFPKDWKCLPDSKWKQIDLSLFLPGWKFDFKNLQCWAAQCPYNMFRGDSIHFPPITNAAPLLHFASDQRTGFLTVSVRSTDFEEIIMANIVFLPASPEFSKPRVIQGYSNPNGTLEFHFIDL